MSKGIPIPPFSSAPRVRSSAVILVDEVVRLTGRSRYTFGEPVIRLGRCNPEPSRTDAFITEACLSVHCRYTDETDKQKGRIRATCKPRLNERRISGAAYERQMGWAVDTE